MYAIDLPSGGECGVSLPARLRCQRLNAKVPEFGIGAGPQLHPSLQGPEQTWELWDEAANTSIRSGPMAATAVDIPQPLPLADGTLDLVGGWVQQQSQAVGQEQILTPDGPSFAIGKNINVARSLAGMAALPNGDLLLTGGVTGFDQSEKLIFTATAERRDASGWSLVSKEPACPGQPGCLLVARGNHTATLLSNGKVFIAGGQNALGAVGQSEFYDPASGNFLPGPMIIPEYGHNATALATTGTSLQATPSSAPFGSQVTLTAAVTAPSGVPSGIVRFLDGQTEVGSAQLVEGKASVNTTSSRSVLILLLPLIQATECLSLAFHRMSVSWWEARRLKQR